jgi:hypothetical protein
MRVKEPNTAQGVAELWLQEDEYTADRESNTALLGEPKLAQYHCVVAVIVVELIRGASTEKLVPEL